MTSTIGKRPIVELAFLRNSSPKTSNATAAIIAFKKAPRQLGGRSRLSSSRSLARARSRASLLFSAAVGLRPVRPRDSIAPAALPLCLVLRLRLVWAIFLAAQCVLDHMAGRIEPGHR